MNETLTTAAVVIAGGGLGSYLRYQVQSWFHAHAGTFFPYGTLVVNVTGAFVIGAIMTFFLKHVEISPHWRLLLVVGVLGGYTTFSSFTWEAYQLFAQGNVLPGFLYVLGSALGGALAVVAGVWIGRLI